MISKFFIDNLPTPFCKYTFSWKENNLKKVKNFEDTHISCILTNKHCGDSSLNNCQVSLHHMQSSYQTKSAESKESPVGIKTFSVFQNITVIINSLPFFTSLKDSEVLRQLMNEILIYLRFSHCYESYRVVTFHNIIFDCLNTSYLFYRKKLV